MKDSLSQLLELFFSVLYVTCEYFLQLVPCLTVLVIAGDEQTFCILVKRPNPFCNQYKALLSLSHKHVPVFISLLKHHMTTAFLFVPMIHSKLLW